MRAGVPVVPIAVTGTEEAMPTLFSAADRRSGAGAGHRQRRAPRPVGGLDPVPGQGRRPHPRTGPLRRTSRPRDLQPSPGRRLRGGGPGAAAGRARSAGRSPVRDRRSADGASGARHRCVDAARARRGGPAWPVASTSRRSWASTGMGLCSGRPARRARSSPTRSPAEPRRPRGRGRRRHHRPRRHVSQPIRRPDHATMPM